MASVVLVEGEDDRQVILQIMNRTGLPEVEVRRMGGIDPLIDGIESAIMMSGRESVGIVADANDNPNRRWTKLCEPLQVLQKRQKYDFDLPDSPLPGGLVRREPKTGMRIGIWLMPNNQHLGEIENFVAKMVPDGDPDWQGAEEYVQRVANTSSLPRMRTVVTNEPRKIEGSALRVWLATGSEPHHMGYATARGDLSLDSPLCKDFCAWLRELLA